MMKNNTYLLSFVSGLALISSLATTSLASDTESDTDTTVSTSSKKRPASDISNTEQPSSKEPRKSNEENNLNLNNTVSQSNGKQTIETNFIPLPNDKKEDKKDPAVHKDEEDYFSSLPYELRTEIYSYLDLKTLHSAVPLLTYQEFATYYDLPISNYISLLNSYEEMDEKYRLLDVTMDKDVNGLLAANTSLKKFHAAWNNVKTQSGIKVEHLTTELTRTLLSNPALQQAYQQAQQGQQIQLTWRLWNPLALLRVIHGDNAPVEVSTIISKTRGTKRSTIYTPGSLLEENLKISISHGCNIKTAPQYIALVEQITKKEEGYINLRYSLSKIQKKEVKANLNKAKSLNLAILYAAYLNYFPKEFSNDPELINNIKNYKNILGEIGDGYIQR